MYVWKIALSLDLLLYFFSATFCRSTEIKKAHKKFKSERKFIYNLAGIGCNLLRLFQYLLYRTVRNICNIVHGSWKICWTNTIYFMQIYTDTIG